LRQCDSGGGKLGRGQRQSRDTSKFSAVHISSMQQRDSCDLWKKSILAGTESHGQMHVRAFSLPFLLQNLQRAQRNQASPLCRYT
jgi:hypothetical protein